MDKTSKHNKSMSTNFSGIFNFRQSSHSILQSSTHSSIKVPFKKSDFLKKEKEKILLENEFGSVPFKDYGENLYKIMDEYKYEGDIDGRIVKKSISINQSNNNSQRNFGQNNSRRSSIDNKPDETVIKVAIHSEEFSNPNQSLEIIKNNKNIYDLMTTTLKSREMFKLKNTMKKIDLDMVKVPEESRIKVMSLMPKNSELISQLLNLNHNNNTTNNNANNINNNINNSTINVQKQDIPTNRNSSKIITYSSLIGGGGYFMKDFLEFYVF